MAATVILEDRSVILLDPEDVERVSEHRWRQFNFVGGTTTIRRIGSTALRQVVSLDKFLLELRNSTPRLRVLHLDGNPFNFQKENLRACSSYKYLKQRDLIKIEQQKSKKDTEFRIIAELARELPLEGQRQMATSLAKNESPEVALSYIKNVLDASNLLYGSALKKR